MAFYTYKAMKAGGDYVSDIISADNQSEAITKLRQLDLFPVKVREASRKEIRELMPDAPIPTKQTYFEFVCESIGDKLIEWGNKLKR